jgi:putative tryptophan/tyrosine transport system substrate-binding protein
VLLATPLAAEAQQAGKIPRIGYLFVGSFPSREDMAKGVATNPFLTTNPFWMGMKELGWVEGQNLIVEWRAGESADQLRAAAADLVRLKVDVLVVLGLGLAGTARLETKTIPIVVQNAGGDLVAAGLVANLARPGGNVTGVQILSDDLISKRLELLKALVPNLSKVAFLGEDVTNSAVPQMLARYVRQATVAARTLGMELHPIIVHKPEDLAPAFLDIAKRGNQGLLAMASFFMYLYRKDIVALAAMHRIPTVYEFQLYPELGGLMSYGVFDSEVRRRAAFLVDKILRGAKPGDLPIERPTKFELVISAKSAKALGLTIPRSLLQQADRVIE